MRVVETVPDHSPEVVVQIGSRWQPGKAERRDTRMGLFECVNPDPGPEDIAVQVALLAKPAKRGVPWRLLWIAAFLGACATAALLKDVK